MPKIDAGSTGNAPPQQVTSWWLRWQAQAATVALVFGVGWGAALLRADVRDERNLIAIDVLERRFEDRTNERDQVRAELVSLRKAADAERARLTAELESARRHTPVPISAPQEKLSASPVAPPNGPAPEAGVAGPPPNEAPSSDAKSKAAASSVVEPKPVRVGVLEITARASPRSGNERVTITLTAKNTGTASVVAFAAQSSSDDRLIDDVTGNSYSGRIQRTLTRENRLTPGMDPATAARSAAAGVRIDAGASADLNFEFSTGRGWRQPTAYELSVKLRLLTATDGSGARYEVSDHPVTISAIPAR